MSVKFDDICSNDCSIRCWWGFIAMSWLLRYYKRAYQEFFKTTADKEPADANTSSSGCVSDYYRFGWLLFLALRVHAFSRFKDLVTCTNGLVSVLVSYDWLLTSHASCILTLKIVWCFLSQELIRCKYMSLAQLHVFTKCLEVVSVIIFFRILLYQSIDFFELLRRNHTVLPHWKVTFAAGYLDRSHPCSFEELQCPWLTIIR